MRLDPYHWVKLRGLALPCGDSKEAHSYCVLRDPRRGANTNEMLCLFYVEGEVSTVTCSLGLHVPLTPPANEWTRELFQMFVRVLSDT